MSSRYIHGQFDLGDVLLTLACLCFSYRTYNQQEIDNEVKLLGIKQKKEEQPFEFCDL